MFEIISFAKKERIDKQYYIEDQQTIELTKNSCNETILKTEDFLVKIRFFMDGLNNEEIKFIRKSFQNI